MGGRQSKKKGRKGRDGTLTPDAASTPGSRDILGLQSPKANRKSFTDHSGGTWPRGAPDPPLSIVILGSENNGKSTLWKSTLSQFGKPLLQWMGPSVKPSVTNNLVTCMRTLASLSEKCGAENEMFRVTSEEAKVACEVLQQQKDDDDGVLSKEFVENAKILWSDSGIQRCYERRMQRDFMLEGADNVRYLMEHIDRIAATDYTPTEPDAIRAYTRTRGTGEHVNHIECRVNQHYLLVYDTDGQRSNRQNWQQVHSFEGVSALVFVVSLTCFDQVLAEDNETNALVDSLDYFEQVCGLNDFKDTPVVVLLNKTDRLGQKLEMDPISDEFPFTLANMNEEQVIEEFTKLFTERYSKVRAGEEIGDTHDFLVVKTLCAVKPDSVQNTVTDIVKTLYAHHANLPKDFYHKRHSTNPLTRIFSNRDLAHDINGV